MTLEEKLANLPDRPGVYIYRDARGQALYVGKAASLRSRVRSYFQEGRPRDPKTDALVRQIADLEVIVTDNELEALMLEANLVRRHRPRYNIVLRDDKHYPFLKLTVNEPFPRLLVARRVQNDGALYYGPYYPATAMRETLRLVRQLFPLRTCSIPIDGTLERPCIQYYIRRCNAPCTGRETREGYARTVRDVQRFLEGRDEDLVARLTREMEQAAAEEKFERYVEDLDEECPRCIEEGRTPPGHLQIRLGRYGRFIGCSRWAAEDGGCRYIRNLNGEERPEPELLDETCPECGRPLVRKVGRYGPFVGCSGYPECRYIKKEPPRSTGVTCPQCGTGQIVEKRTRFGLMYGCDRYPECDFAVGNPPEPDHACPECGSLLLRRPKSFRCWNCGAELDLELQVTRHGDPEAEAAARAAKAAARAARNAKKTNARTNARKANAKKTARRTRASEEPQAVEPAAEG